MKKYPFGRIVYLSIVVIIGVSAAFFELTYHTQKGNYFTLFSPLPIVFSIGRGQKIKEVTTQLAYYENQQEKFLRFNRDFYLSLGGPHHYRLLFMLKLKRPQFITQSDFPIFLFKTFCQGRIKPFRNSQPDNIKFIIKNNYGYNINDLLIDCKK